MQQPKNRRPSSGKRKPPPVTLAKCTAWQAPLDGQGGKPDEALKGREASGDGVCEQ